MRTVRLEDLAEIDSGSTPPRADERNFGGEIPWAKIQDLTRAGMLLRQTDEHVSALGLKAGRLRIFPVGTVLLAMYGSIGTVSIAATPTATNQAILGIRCGPGLDPAFLYFYLRWVQPDLVALGRGGTQSNINAAMVRGLRIPSIPRAAQEQIASALRLQTVAADLAIAANRTRLNRLDETRDAFVRDVVDGIDAEPQPLSATGRLHDGDWILTADYAPTGVRLLQVGDVGRGTLLATSNRYVPEERAKTLNCTFLNKGDILISRMADPIGRACIVPDLGYDAITAVDVTIFRADPAILDVEFAVQFMNDRSWLRAVAAKASGATRARISRNNLEAMEIPVPDLESQRRIALELAKRMSALEAVGGAIRAEQEAIDALPAALLRRAFEDVAA